MENVYDYLKVMSKITYRGSTIEVDGNNKKMYKGMANEEDDGDEECDICKKGLAKEKSSETCTKLFYCDGCNTFFCKKHFTNAENYKFYERNADDGVFYCIVCDIDVQKDYYKEKQSFKKRKVNDSNNDTPPI